jgi:hypothetical protein
MRTRLALLTVAFFVATTVRSQTTTDFQSLARLFDYDAKQPLDLQDKIIEEFPDGTLHDIYCDVVGQVDAIHFVGHAAPIPLLLQFANYEQYFDKISMQHYIGTASDPKKVLFYDTGHDLNDFQALEDRYEWLVNQIHLRREPILQETK